MRYAEINLLIWVRKAMRRKARKRRAFMNYNLAWVNRLHTKQKFRVTMFLSQIMNANSYQRTPRAAWEYPRREFWFSNMWDNRLVENFEGGKWKADFRMNGNTFSKLVELLKPYMQKKSHDSVHQYLLKNVLRLDYGD